MKIALRYGLIFAGIGYAACAIFMVHAIMQSPSSTAAIGLIFVPIWALVYAIPVFAVGYCVGYLIDARKSKNRNIFRMNVAGILVILILDYSAITCVHGFRLENKVKKIENMAAPEIATEFATPEAHKNKFILGAIAQNENTSSEILHQIAQIEDDDLHHRMSGSSFLFDYFGKNKHGFSVMRLVAHNPNVDVKTLELLTASPDEYVLNSVAMNKKLPEATLRLLYENSKAKDGYVFDMVKSGLAYNPNTPKDLLTIIAKDKNEYTRAAVAQNSNTLVDDLVLLSRDPAWNVRGNVALNAATPAAVVLRLTKDSDERVRRYASMHVKR